MTPVASRYNLFTTIMLYGLCSLMILSSMYFIWENAPRLPHDRDALWLVITLAIVIVLISSVMFYSIKKYLKRVLVDSEGITCVNICRSRETYLFSELEGFRIHRMRSRNTEYRILYLVKNGKSLNPIPSSFYSNFDELVDAVRKNLGEKK